MTLLDSSRRLFRGPTQISGENKQTSSCILRVRIYIVLGPPTSLHLCSEMSDGPSKKARTGPWSGAGRVKRLLCCRYVTNGSQLRMWKTIKAGTLDVAGPSKDYASASISWWTIPFPFRPATQPSQCYCTSIICSPASLLWWGIL